MPEDSDRAGMDPAEVAQVELSLRTLDEHRRASDERFARIASALAASCGAVVGASMASFGIVPMLAIVAAIIPGAIAGALTARSAGRFDRKLLLKERELEAKRARLRAPRKSLPSATVVEVLRALLAPDDHDSKEQLSA